MARYSQYSNIDSAATMTTAGLNFWYKQGTRSGVTLPNSLNPGTNDATILYPYINKSSTLNNFYVQDNGGLDIGLTDFTIAGWFYVQNANNNYYMAGKPLASSLDGRYYLYCIKTSGYLRFSAEPSGGIKSITGAADITAEWHFIVADINQVTKKIRLFCDNAQVGADTAFTGTFGSPDHKYKFCIGGTNNIDGDDFTGIAPESFYNIGIWNRLLTPTEQTTLYNGGYVSGFKAFWPGCGGIDFIGDASGNGYHLRPNHYNYENAAVNYGTNGTNYALNYGYTQYTNGFHNVDVPNTIAGAEVAVSSIMEGYKEHGNNHTGTLTDHNLADSMIVIPTASWDKSNAIIWSDSIRTLVICPYYDAANPTHWHPQEFNNLLMQSCANAGYKGTNFVKVSDHSYKDRKLLTDIFSYDTDKTGADYSKIVSGFCKDYVYIDTYENDYIYWRYDASSIIASKGTKVVKWIDAATDTFSLSLDYGVTYPYTINSPFNGEIPKYCHIYDNDNIVIGGLSKLYLSTDNLGTFNEVVPTGADGNPFVGSTNCYNELTNTSFNIDGIELELLCCYTTHALSEYINVNMFESVDSGVHYKSVYKANYTNPPLLEARHLHFINFKSYSAPDAVFWLTTGDNADGRLESSNIIECTRNMTTGAWSFVKLYGDTDGGNTYKCNQFIFPDALTCANTDDDTEVTTYNGFWKCAIADLGDKSNAVLLFRTPFLIGHAIYDLPYIIIGAFNVDVGAETEYILITSSDGIENLRGFRLWGLPQNINGIRAINSKNDEDWYLMNTRIVGDTDINQNRFKNGILWVKIK